MLMVTLSAGQYGGGAGRECNCPHQIISNSYKLKLFIARNLRQNIQIDKISSYKRSSVSVAAPGLGIWVGIWGANSYFGGGQDRIFKKVLLYRHRGTNILGISPPPQRGECPRNIAPPPPPPPPLGYSLPIYAMWFIQIIS